MRRSRAVRFYRLLLELMPARVKEADAEETADVFAEQWSEARTKGHRIATAFRAFGRLPFVLGAEWRDEFRARRDVTTEERMRGGRMEEMARVIRQGTRSLNRSRTFSLSVVLLLGLGVGSVSAIFAIVDHVLLRQLPYPDAERLVLVENGAHSGPSFQDFSELRSVEAWSASSADAVNVTGEGQPVRALEALISSGFFEMFGARQVAGRLLSGDDFETDDRVVLSHGAWLRFFGGDPSAIGREIRINGEGVQVIGVLDAGFHPPEAMMNTGIDFYRPLDFATEGMQRRSHHTLQVVGRLAPTATMAALQEEADRLAETRAKAFPDNYVNRDGRIDELPVVSLQEGTVGSVRRGLGLLFGAVTLLLLVACANVTHLFLARAIERTREMSLRRALGAGNRTLLSQLFVESLLLGLPGAILGVGLAAAALQAFAVLDPGGLPRVTEITIDVRVTLFAASIAILTAVAFGMIPAMRLAAVDPGGVLRATGRHATGTRRTHVFRNTLVAAEVALSLVLIAQAGWLLRSFVRLHQEPLGFRTAGIYTIPLRLTNIDSPETWNRRLDAMRQALNTVPDVRNTTFAMSMPLEWTGGGRCCWSTLWREAATDGEWLAFVHAVDSHYFDVFAMTPLAGRLWAESDARSEPVPIAVTEPFAVEAFGNAAAALGRQLNRNDVAHTIVAVLPDNRHYGADRDHGPAVYVPTASVPFAIDMAHFAVFAPDTRPGFAGRIRDAIWSSEPDLPVPTIRAMSEWSTLATARVRFESALTTVFGLVALLLVAGGLAGTLLYTVGLEQREMGIRLALGATGHGLERRVMRRGLLITAGGAIVGSTAAWMAGRLLESRLFGVDARDPGTLALATTFLLTVAAFASWIPARRAAATDPMESLRTE